MSRTHHHGEWKPWVKRPAGAYWASMTPGWWTKTFMNRPKRRRDARMLRGVLVGSVDMDAAVWELGNHKPHYYYW
jgi:hypothetical protein